MSGPDVEPASNERSGNGTNVPTPNIKAYPPQVNKRLVLTSHLDGANGSNVSETVPPMHGDLRLFHFFLGGLLDLLGLRDGVLPGVVLLSRRR